MADAAAPASSKAPLDNFGPDIEMGQRNFAGAQTNLFVKDGGFTGVVLFNVDASIANPPTQRTDGIHAVSSGTAPGRGVMGFGLGDFTAADYSAGVVGSGPVGVVGKTDQSDDLPSLPPLLTNAGVVGSCNAQGAGVMGINESVPGVGVYGRGGGGVIGESDVGLGVIGLGGPGAPGVVGYGRTGNPDGGQDGADGVQGWSFGAGAGVAGYAVYPAGVGVQAWATSVNGMGLFATDFDPSGREVGQAAGWFDGRVVVDGDLLVFGAKGAVVRQRDGSHRMLYSVESPESWFEDFGESRLVDGEAKVNLEPLFASVIRTDSFHVFLSPYGDSNGLYVSQRSENSFDVREQGNGKANIGFSYRIVAKRKDIEGERLAKVAMPEVSRRETVGEIFEKRKELSSSSGIRAVMPEDG